MDTKFIYGKNDRQGIVSVEVDRGELVLFYENRAPERLPAHFWMLSDKDHGSWHRLEGDLHYKWLKIFDSEYALSQERRRLASADIYVTYDPKEAAMQMRGLTYFKGLKVSDLSVLSFDIESTGLEHNDDSKVLLISNTFRRAGITTRKLFAYDEYDSPAAMFDAWCEWVRDMDPSVVLGHNIYGYDLPYMEYCAARAGTELTLGRDESAIQFASYESKYRKGDGQFLKYHRASIYGREIVDTMFLSLKYDIGRKYENYRLKNIISQEGLERSGRVFYDAALIRVNHKDPVEWAKIKAYAEHDADDALALYDLMIPAFFYLNQSVPKSFQSMMTSASGGQINSFLVRSYLQILHSIPKADESEPYEGAISIGNPGLYHNVFKVDVASLYPSIMLQHKVYDATKDPKAHFLAMVEHFTKERLANKKRAKETGETYFKDLEQAQKIVINSAYGLLGVPGLNFNSPAKAALVTEKGRDILTVAMNWAAGKYKLVNADTDSISISSTEIWNEHHVWHVLENLNELSGSGINWTDDGTYRRVLVLKAKNYVLDDGKSIKIKGSALKASLKGTALKELITRGINQLLDGNTNLVPLYNSYAREILTIQDISRWATKKSYSEAVASSGRTNEARARSALSGTDYRPGDKFYVYFREDDSLGLIEHWTGDHDASRLLGKLYDTIQVFETVADVSGCLNYTLKRNKERLHALT